VPAQAIGEAPVAAATMFSRVVRSSVHSIVASRPGGPTRLAAQCTAMTKHACAAQPIARQFTTEYAHEGEGAGASERDVDDSDRAAEFKRMFTELQELPHVCGERGADVAIASPS